MDIEKANILLVGSGGIGTIAALNLEVGGQAKVTAVLRSNYDTVTRKGFTIRSCEHGNFDSWRPTQVLSSVPQITDLSRPFDYIVCCTKNISDVSPTVVDILAPAVTPGHTAIVLIQNGLNIQNPIIERFPLNVAISGVSRNDAHEIALGVVEQKQQDLLYIGAFYNHHLSKEKQETAAQNFVRIYGAGMKTACLYRPDVNSDRWTKLVYNASLNPICALTNLNISELHFTGRAIDSLIVPAMKEVLQVAEAAGYPLSQELINITIQSNPIEENITPSMQVDMQKGNLLEHENILGEIVREAKGLKVATPVLVILYELCCAHQWKLKRGR